MRSMRDLEITGKKLFISVNFDVFMLNLTVQFVLGAEIMKIENKYMTVMFAAFQKFQILHQIQIFGGHIGRHLGIYAIVIDFYIFELCVLYFI